MTDQLQPEAHPQMARPRPRPNKPLPFEEYENYCDYPPEDLELEEVELIWWALASQMSLKELRKRLTKVIDEYEHSGCFHFAAVADSQFRGRYPRGVMRTLKQVLTPRRLMPKNYNNGAYYIQSDVWHICIYKALEWCPSEALPRYLRIRKLEDDLGM